SNITKPQEKKANQKQDNNVSQSIALLGETEDKLPKGKSAPRTSGTLNGHIAEFILDGGCTSYIISLKLAKEMGIRDVEPCNQSVMFGDGKQYDPIGIAKNIRLQVGDSEVISVNAMCFDVGDRYGFIVGREGLHALRIGTDWSSHFWYLKNDMGTVPLSVHYTKNMTRDQINSDDEEYPEDDDLANDNDYQEDHIDQDDNEEGHLIIEASDDEEGLEDNPIESNDGSNENRLGGLLDRITLYENINNITKAKLIQLVIEYKDCFGTGYEHLSQTNLLKFHVDTGNAKPIYKRPYAFLSLSEKRMLKKDLELMVQQGILVPNTHVPNNSSQSGWSFPCRYVPKKTGDKRLVTNFRELNAVTVRDTWPLPNVIDVLESLAGAHWFGILDLLKAFQQIAVEEDFIQKLTIATPWGNYSYR
ncbi:hypothetical protein A0J61_11650, partial [Choanephora cucurbitarum]